MKTLNISKAGCGLRRFFLALALVFLAAPAARAGLSLELNVIRYDPNGYYFFPNLGTNSASPMVLFGDYTIASPTSPTSGSTEYYHFDVNGFNQTGGISYGYNNLADMLHELTNGTWSIFVTNSVTTNIYHFTVTASISSNDLPLVNITFPVNGAVNVTNQPMFTWQGPTNFSDLVVYEYNRSSYLPVTQTDWLSPNMLYQGINNFTVHYDNYSTTSVVSSTPLDSSAQAISSWVSTAHMQDYISSQFTVGTADTSGTYHTLVAHYPWDDTNSDGSAVGADISGNGYDLNFGGGYGAQGGVNSTDDTAVGPLAIQFHNGDGNSAGYVGWDPTPSGLLTALSGSFTVSCWIKTTQTIGGDQDPAYNGAGIVAADDNGQDNDVVPIALTGSKIGFNTGGDEEDVTLNSSASVNDGNYHHIVVTRNQQTGQKIIYIDGVLDSFSSGTTNLLSNPQKLTIGALADASDPDAGDFNYYNGFDGEVDDLQIYSGALSAGDVANLYANPGSTAVNGGGPVGGHKNVAHYAFENGDNLGQDSSGNGNNLFGPTVWGPMYQPDADAEAGSGAVQFFGTSALNASDQPLTNLNAVLADSFTFSAWVKTTVTNGLDYNNAFFGAVIFWAYNDQGDTNDTIPLSITGSKAAFTTRGSDPGASDTLHSLTSVNDGNYHLITVTRDQSTGEKKMYVDGNFETSEIGTTNPLNSDNYRLTIGGYAYCTDSNCTNFYAYNGLLDDLQIYSGVLSSAEIAALYANPGTTAPDVAGGLSGPNVHYDFDAGTVLAADVSGNNNNIIYAGSFSGDGPAISSDAAAGAGSVHFDGGSYLTASSNLLATLAGEFSVSLWLKTAQNYGSQGDFAWEGAGIVAADSPYGGDRDLIPVALTGGQVAFNVGDGDADDTLNSVGTVNNGVWHHIVVTRSLSTGLRQIFIDGAFDSSKGGTTDLLNSPVLLTIGAKSNATNPDPSSPDYNGSNGYDGLLDDVQIYNRVLNGDEVTYLHAHPGAALGGGNVVIAPAPFITVNPVNQTNYPGYNVALHAAATGTPTPTWQWFSVSSGLIAGATNALYIPANSGSNSVAGNYYAIASNAGGSANTTTAAVTFVASAPLPDWTHASGTPYHAAFDTNVIKDYYGGCVVDSAGEIFVADQYVGNVILRTNFVTVNTLTAVGTNGGAALVKHDPDGNPIWAVGLTNNQVSSYSYADCVALAPGNGAYLVSALIGTNWLGTNRYANTTSGGSSLLLSRFDANGSNVWSRLIGQTNQVFALYNSLVSDSSGNVTLSGLMTGSADFGGTNLTASGYMGFMAQYNASGTLLWAQLLPIIPWNLAYGDGRLYVSLQTTASAGVTNVSIGSLSNVTDRAWAIACLAATNGQALWLNGVGGQYGAKTNGGFSDDIPLVSIAGSDVFLTGSAYGFNAVFGNLSVFLPDGRNQYFARYDTNGNAQVATTFGGPTTMPWASAANSSGVYISGDFDGYSQFGNAFIAAPVNTTNYLGPNYFTQAFVAKFDRDGNPLWARNGTSTLQANYRGVAVAADGIWASGILLVDGGNHLAQFGTNDIGSNAWLDYFGDGVIALYTPGGLLTKITETAAAPGSVALLNPQTVGANFQFQFQSQSGFNYNILYRTNLVVGNWQTNSTVVGDGSVKTVPLPMALFNGAPQGFIRVSTQ